MLGRPDFTPVTSSLVGMRLTPQAQSGLSRTTQTVMRDAGLSRLEPVVRTVEALMTERRSLYEQAQQLVGPVAQKTFRQIGSTTVAITASPIPGSTP